VIGLTVYVLLPQDESVPFDHGPDWPQPLTAASA